MMFGLSDIRFTVMTVIIWKLGVDAIHFDRARWKYYIFGL